MYDVLVGSYGENTSLARQELEGEELVMEDLVYPVWDTRRHVVPRSKWPKQEFRHVIAGVDFGFAVPSAVVVVGIDDDGRHYVLDEFYRKGMSQQGLADACWDLKRKHKVEWFVCDSADPNWIRFLKMAHLPALAAKKRVGTVTDPSSGIGLVYALMAGRMADGTNKLYVDPRCVNLRRELDNYVRDDAPERRDPGERPRKLNDHAADALRYATTAIALYYGNQKAAQMQSMKFQWAS
jgi:phage terminase large subunit